MGTYVVFNRETGEIIHTHREASLLGEPRKRSREDVLELSRRAREEAAPDWDVVELEQDILQEVGPGREIYVDVERRVLRERAKDRES
jgi:hypothetical protein